MPLGAFISGKILYRALSIDCTEMRELGVVESERHLGAAVLGHTARTDTGDELCWDAVPVDAGIGDGALEHGEKIPLAHADEAELFDAVA